MTSNYPPGCTGNEFAISGPDREWEERSECGNCEHTEINIHQSHPAEGVWFICSHCDYVTELDFPEDEPEPDPDDWLDQKRDRGNHHVQ